MKTPKLTAATRAIRRVESEQGRPRLPIVTRVIEHYCGSGPGEASAAADRAAG
jgi:hypothetical protein